MIRALAARFARRVGAVFPGVAMSADNALMLIKAVIAGTIAWALATEVFHASNASFAAFAAMLLMQQTIADSVQKALHYTAAVLVGIGLVSAVALPWGPGLWLFPLILLASMLIGRWYRLGSQGFNVTVAAVFAYGVVAMPDAGTSPLMLIGDLAAMVLLGAGIAVGTNLLIAPPLRYRSAEDAVGAYCQSVVALLDDMVAGLGDGAPDDDQARDWRRRSDELPGLSAQPRSTIDHALQTSKFNPRRLVTRGSPTFDGHRVTVHVVERISQQLVFVCAGLLRFTGSDEDESAGRRARTEFFGQYAAVLSAVRDAIAESASLHSMSDLRAGTALTTVNEQCRSALDTLSSAAAVEGEHDKPRQWAFFGALYADAQRICEEIEWADDQFQQLAQSSAGRP